MELSLVRLSKWLAPLAQYLYVSDLIEGRDVLDIGCGTGAGCEFLASHGAASVLGIDSDPELVTEARLRHPMVNVQYQVYGHVGIELDDDSVGLIFVRGAELLRRSTTIDELRRVLRPDGVLVWSAPSADRSSVTGGVSYHEFEDRLGSQFGSHRMVAVEPLVALSLVEYSDDVPTVELDTSLGLLGGEERTVTDYLAIFDPQLRPARPYSIIQMPTVSGVAVIESALGIAVSDAERFREALETERGARHSAESLVSDLKIRVAELERGIAESAVVDQLGEFVGTTESAAKPAANLVHAMEAHAAKTRALEEEIRENLAYISELEDGRIEIERDQKAVQDELAAERARVETMREQLNQWRDRTARAEGTVLRLEHRLGTDGGVVDLVDTGESREWFARAEEAVGEQEEVVAQMYETLATIRSLVRALEEDSRAGVEESASQHRLAELAREAGAHDAEVAILTVGIRSLKERMATAADDLAVALDSEADGKLAAETDRIVELLRRFSE